MAKQRNSLGICVLPIPVDGGITWEEYKEKYKIDLEEIFKVVLIGSTYYVRFKNDFSKLIVLDFRGEVTQFPKLATPNAYGYASGANPEDAFLTISVIKGDYDAGYTLTIGGDKKIGGGEI